MRPHGRPGRAGFALLLSLGSAAAIALALAGSGCSSLLPRPEPPPAVFTLDGRTGLQHAVVDAPGLPPSGSAGSAPSTLRDGLTLIVNAPQADAGYDSPSMLYTRQPHRLEPYARSVWVDTPARMLAPLIARAVVQGGAIGAAVLPSAAAAGSLRLATEIVRLQQDYTSRPSRVRLTLRATVLDDATRVVLATREFDETATAPSDSPEGGVAAANAAAHAVLQSLASWCNGVAAGWSRTAGAPGPSASPAHR